MAFWMLTISYLTIEKAKIDHKQEIEYDYFESSNTDYEKDQGSNVKKQNDETQWENQKL